MKAKLSHYKQSPRKVRIVANLIKGKPVLRALVELSQIGKRAAHPIKKLIESASANAQEASGVKKEDLIIKEIRVDEGRVLKRHRARSRGRAGLIMKRTSHVALSLEEKKKKNSKIQTPQKEVKKPEAPKKSKK